MSEPSARSRSATGIEVGRGGDEGDGEQVDAVLDRELDPAEVAVGRRRQRGRAPGMFIPLWEESVPPTSTSQSTPSLLGLADPQADRAVGEVDELVLAQRGDARPGDRDRLARRPRPRAG